MGSGSGGNAAAARAPSASSALLGATSWLLLSVHRGFGTKRERKVPAGAVASDTPSFRPEDF